MSYSDDDPRSALAGPKPATASDDAPVRAVTYFDDAQLRSGPVRGQNALVEWSEHAAEDVLEHSAADEHILLLVAGSPAVRITAGDHEVTVLERAVIVIPPGRSRVETLGEGPIVRVFTTRGPGADRAINAAAYAQPDTRCTPLGAPTAAPGGIRVHTLRGHPVVPGTFGRMFRTADLMINVLADEDAPRDPHKLSPHDHQDFEQLSLAVAGEFVHHIRYPWTPDSTLWREDEHHQVGSPSLTVIPPPVIHTTQGIGQRQHLVDVFAPPRTDFLEQGWVRNAEDYT